MNPFTYQNRLLPVADFQFVAPDINKLATPLLQGMDAYQRQQNEVVDQGFRREQLGLQKRAADRADQELADAREQRLAIKMSGLAQVIHDDPNPATAQANWQRLRASMPGMDDKLRRYGVDPNDHVTGTRFVMGEAGQYKSANEREKERLGIDLQRSQIAGQGLQQQLTQAQLDQVKSQTPAWREANAERFGIQKNTPAWQAFVVAGQLPSQAMKFQVVPDGASVMVEDPNTGKASIIHQGQPKVDSTTRKHIFDAQDELPVIKGSIEMLDEAKRLIPKAYHGFGSQMRSFINQGLPAALPNIFSDPERAQATSRLNALMSEQAIEKMSASLKGATTDREMMAFRDMIANPNVSPEVKLQAIETMRQRAMRHYQNKVDRIKELGGRMPDLGQSPGGQAGQMPDPLGIR